MSEISTRWGATRLLQLPKTLTARNAPIKDSLSHIPLLRNASLGGNLWPLENVSQLRIPPKNEVVPMLTFSLQPVMPTASLPVLPSVKTSHPTTLALPSYHAAKHPMLLDPPKSHSDALPPVLGRRRDQTMKQRRDRQTL